MSAEREDAEAKEPIHMRGRTGTAGGSSSSCLGEADDGALSGTRRKTTFPACPLLPPPAGQNVRDLSGLPVFLLPFPALWVLIDTLAFPILSVNVLLCKDALGPLVLHPLV